MKHLKRIKQGLCLAAVLCAGCSGSGSDYNNSGAVAAPPGANAVDYTMFVQAQFLTPGVNETATPVEVETTQFTFGDQDNPTAFDFTISSAP